METAIQCITDVHANDLLTTFISILEKSFNLKCFVVLITNVLDQVDPSAVSRCAIKTYIGAPGTPELEKMLNKYINKYLVNNKFKVHESVYSALPELAKNATGLVGRDIDGVIQKAAYSLLGTKDKELTADMLKKHIDHTVQQHHETQAYLQ